MALVACRPPVWPGVSAGRTGGCLLLGLPVWPRHRQKWLSCIDVPRFIPCCCGIAVVRFQPYRWRPEPLARVAQACWCHFSRPDVGRGGGGPVGTTLVGARARVSPGMSALPRRPLCVVELQLFPWFSFCCLDYTSKPVCLSCALLLRLRVICCQPDGWAFVLFGVAVWAVRYAVSACFEFPNGPFCGGE